MVAVVIAGQAVDDAAQASASVASAPRPSVEGLREGGSASSDAGSAPRAYPCRIVVVSATGTAPIAQVNVATGEVLFLHGDSIGSTRSVTDALGAVVAEFDYSLYGTVATVSGDAGATRFLFAGEYLDPSGDYYLRNRVYDPASASFLSVDPALAATGMPYAYTPGNPLQAVDPLGLNWLSDTLTSPAFWAGTAVFIGCELATGGTGSVLCLAGAGAVASAVDYVETTPAECQTLTGYFTHTLIGAGVGVLGGRLFGPALSKVFGAGGRSLLRIAPTFIRKSLGSVAEAASARLTAFTEAVQQRTGNLFAQARAALAANTEASLYRGVGANHPGYANALEGTAAPRGGLASAAEHNLGSTLSPYTSWTTDLKVAQGFAGEGGVVLRIPQVPRPGNPFVWSPDRFFESEVLIEGTVTGAKVLP